MRKPLHVRNWSFAFPPLPLAIGQLIVGPLNFACVAACLHQSIQAFAQVDYPAVATAYVLANAASLISHVPGGLGVIESVIVYLVPGANLIAALIVFRAAYFFIPLVFGVITFGSPNSTGERRRRAHSASFKRSAALLATQEPERLEGARRIENARPENWLGRPWRGESPNIQIPDHCD